MNATEWKAAIASGALRGTLARLYGERALRAQEGRYQRALDRFAELYPEAGGRDLRIFSVPGRSEICGNHTDHNHGLAVAASVDLDIIAIAAKCGGDTVHIVSEGFPGDHVKLSRLSPSDYPSFKSVSLVAGMVRAFRDHGVPVEGLCAYTTSTVLKGSGLSSSAAFEVMVGTVLNHLFAGGSVEPTTIAKWAKWAENVYFGKPCGLLDQTACAVGGYIFLDFKDPSAPLVERIPFDLSSFGYSLVITDTGGSHSDMGGEYAAIPEEMRAVASALGAPVLRETYKDAVLAALPSLREKCGDRAVLRALHFFDENERVRELRGAMREGNLRRFLSQISASGASSRAYLQNVAPPALPREQPISVALYAAENFLSALEEPSACRVHGGGFAGTMQAFLPSSAAPRFIEEMNAIFGRGAARATLIRQTGACEVTVE